MSQDVLLEKLLHQARLVGRSAEREMALKEKVGELIKILRTLEAVDFGRAEWTDAAERAAVRARAILKEGK